MLEQTIAEAVRDSFWAMQGGEGSNPEPPTAGDQQVAYDVMRAMGLYP
jgi:hypothetical protein